MLNTLMGTILLLINRFCVPKVDNEEIVQELNLILKSFEKQYALEEFSLKLIP